MGFAHSGITDFTLQPGDIDGRLMMQSELITTSIAILLTFTALILLLLHDWRISLIVLAIQYMGVFILVLSHWSLEMAVTKLIAGWISAAVIGMAISANTDISAQTQADKSNLPDSLLDQARSPAQSGLGLAFRILTSGLVVLTIASQMESITSWLPDLEAMYAWGGLILIGFGLVKLGFTDQPLHILIALLTSLAGFEILYAALDQTVISAGLFAAVNLALALVGAYLLTAPYMEAGT
jgi:hypothetical protein